MTMMSNWRVWGDLLRDMFDDSPAHALKGMMPAFLQGYRDAKASQRKAEAEWRALEADIRKRFGVGDDEEDA